MWPDGNESIVMKELGIWNVECVATRIPHLEFLIPHSSFQIPNSLGGIASGRMSDDEIRVDVDEMLAGA